MAKLLDFWLEETAGTIAQNRGSLGVSANGTVNASANLNVSGQIGSGIQWVADVAAYDAVPIPDLPALDLEGFDNDLTLMGWLYATTNLAADNSIIFGREFTSSVYWRAGIFRARMGGALATVGNFTLGAWNHFCIVCQQNGANRELVAHLGGGAAAGGSTSTQIMTASSAPTDPWKIRETKVGTDTLTLDEMKLWNEALSDAEVAEIYLSELAGKRLGGASAGGMCKGLCSQSIKSIAGGVANA